jgi:glycosyltransferase involved in cell wall biosynthesis
VVGTRVVGSREAVEDEVTGLLVEQGNAAALASAVLRLLSDPALRARIQAAAKDKVSRNHTRERTAADTESFYCRLTQSRARQTSDV